jgi:hypothetical protein
MRGIPNKFAAVVLLLTSQSALVLADDNAAIPRIFDEYKSALLSQRGTAAAELLSADSIAFYDSLRELALFGTKDEIIARPGEDILHVLQIRRELEPDRIQQMSGRDLAAYFVDAGWYFLNDSVKLVPESISVTNDEAVADFTIAGSSVRGQLTFFRENGSWRFSIMPFVAASRTHFDRMMRLIGLKHDDIDEFVTALLFDEEFDRPIWQPPFQRP